MNIFKRTTQPTSPTPTDADYQWAVNQAISRLGSVATVGQLAATAHSILAWEYRDANVDSARIDNLLIRVPFI